MSNWFSSLRRPQKNKKSNNKKKLQKSCIDLTSNSTFYTDIPISTYQTTNDHNYKETCISTNNVENTNHLTSQEKHKVYSELNNYEGNSNFSTDSDNSSLGSEKKSLLSGRNVRDLCSKCCCQFQKPSTGIFIVKNHSDDKSEFTIETDCVTDVKVTKIPSPNGNNLIYNKRSATKRTTTTLVTRTTTLLTNKSGLIFDDHGKVISQHFRKFRASSLGSILDDNNSDISNSRNSVIINEGDNSKVKTGNCDDSHLNFSNNSKIYSSSLQNSPLLECNDFLFIDETNSSAENYECNRLNLINSNSNKNKYNNNNIYDKSNIKQCDSEGICIACKGPLTKQENFYQNPNKKAEFHNFENNKNYINGNHEEQIKDELCEVVSEMETLDSQEGCKHSNKDKQMSIGRKKFNMDPKKGIEYLVDNHLLRMDPQDVAHFLYKGEGLNKTAIGDYLGEKNDFNEQVLKAFVELHDFTNLILVQALRQFLWSFRLPGEAQKIDRMMECFAQRYCQLNPDIFTNTDTCYVLSFAIIMLNTSLHNPSVKDKPSVEQFITMNRGINNGGDLPRSLLESLYESIRTEPFKIPQDDGNDLMHTFFNPDKEGWLWKQGGRYKSWKRRWFILNDNCLYYFEYTTDKEPRGIIPLENISVREIQDRSKPHCFELYASGGADIIKACKTDSEGKVVEGKHTVYRMSAATEEDKLEWIKRLTQSISHNPFYDILVQRKKKALAKS